MAQPQKATAEKSKTARGSQAARLRDSAMLRDGAAADARQSRSPHSRLMQLQRAVGSEAVSRLLRSRAIQAKLKVGAVGDPLEREADHVAERVMRMTEPRLQRACACGGSCSKCQTDHEPELMQTKRADAGSSGQTAAPPIVHETLRSPGQPLDPATRAFMEPRFGHDFRNVRVHADKLADDSAAAVGAIAYTVASDVVFAQSQYSPSSAAGRQLLAHELAHVVQQRGQDAGERGFDNTSDIGMKGVRMSVPGQASKSVQRKCRPELGTPVPDCTPSNQGSAGWQFLFKADCDDLLPDEAAKIDKLKIGSKLKIHGFASRAGKDDPTFADNLSCHRANRIAELARAQRADCPVIGIFKHGASPVSAPGLVPDVNPPEFWRSVIIEEIKPGPQPGEEWLDPSAIITQGWPLYDRAKQNPTQTNLDIVAARRAQIKKWLEDIPKLVAPTDVQLGRRDLDNYRRFYESGEKLWTAIDQLLAPQKHAAATTDTHDAWAAGTGRDQGAQLHAKHVPTGAKYHIDIFGEGYFPGAINIGMATRTSTTGVHDTRVPNLIYRKFSGKDVNHLPIADHTADLVTSENGPLQYPGLAEEIARIIAPGGTIILYSPDNMEQYHDKVAKATGGTITKEFDDTGVRTIESRIVAPGP